MDKFEQLQKGITGRYVPPPSDIPITAEKEANNVQYKGFVLYRSDPTRTWFWKIKTDIPELSNGSYTKLTEAQKAIDLYQKKERELQDERQETTSDETHANWGHQEIQAPA
jgi:hypothetical protein